MRRWSVGLIFATVLVAVFSLVLLHAPERAGPAAPDEGQLLAAAETPPAAPPAADPVPRAAAPRAEGPADAAPHVFYDLPETRLSIPIRGEDGRPDLDAMRNAQWELMRAERYAEADKLLWWLWTKGDAYAETGEAFQFMLAGQWGELAEAYPPARQSLSLARDHSLARWEVDRDVSGLIEMVRANAALAQNDRTADLARAWASDDPDAAARLVDMSFGELAEIEEYDLLSAHTPDWTKRYVQEEESLTRRLAEAEVEFRRLGLGERITLAQWRTSHVTFHDDEVRTLEAVLRGAGRAEDADALAARWAAYLAELPADIRPTADAD